MSESLSSTPFTGVGPAVVSDVNGVLAPLAMSTRNCVFPSRSEALSGHCRRVVHRVTLIVIVFGVGSRFDAAVGRAAVVSAPGR